MIQIFEHKAFQASLSDLSRAGGERKRRAEKVFAVLGKLKSGTKALDELPKTNHGEGRIKHCVKYDLGGGYRLVTVQTEKMLGFCFAGDHEATEKWLDGHRGLLVAKNRIGSWEAIYQSASVDEPIQRPPTGSPTLMLERVDETYLNQLLDGVPATVITKLGALGPTTNPATIETVCAGIQDHGRRMLVYDVLCLVLSGDRAAAESRLDLEFGAATAFEELSPQEVLEVKDGDTVRRLRIGTPAYEKWLNAFSRSSQPLEWLLFLHPEQADVADANFSGPAQLSGVSGSGKTCVAIHRALRLASEAPGKRLLIVTLNRALAGLIRTLVDASADSETTAAAISVKSFFQLCQELLHRMEPHNSRLYDDVSWKLEEHIDEVYREFYRCWTNNDAARILGPIHQSLISRGVCAETYVREEFDWIRSALSNHERERYLDIERAGRKIPMPQEWRTRLLQGLKAWEEKMRAVGVIDYLGLTAALSTHQAALKAEFDHVIVDEAQDFGTSEIRILRLLCKSGPNDMFLCGDIAQHVLPKHRSLSAAGVDTANRSRRIVRNYRNTREILMAAYLVLIDNLDEGMLDSADLEILDPKYASRSSSVPVVVRADTLSEELGYARTFVRDHVAANPHHRCCIALAGYSIKEVSELASRLGIPVLLGERGPVQEPIVIADLEQTKGYEFNVMVIVNCRKGVLPPEGTAPEEAFRHGCRLYVAMTRARDELILSYSGEVTDWLAPSNLLAFMDWAEVALLDESLIAAPPEALGQSEPGAGELLKLKGRDFLYLPAARGLSVEAIQKIEELVDGVGLIRGRTRVRWRDMRTLHLDLNQSTKAKQIFGPVVQVEVKECLDKLADRGQRRVSGFG